MSPNDSDVTLATLSDAELPRPKLDGDIPWGGLALSGMGLIAVSLVVFVMVTESAERPPAKSPALVDALPPKRISVPDLPSVTPALRPEDATSSIARSLPSRAAPGHLAAPPPGDR